MAHNVMIDGHYPSYAIGTIPAAGTLSQELDLSSWSMVGLIATNIDGEAGTGFVTGTLGFYVSPYSQNDDRFTDYVPVKDTSNAAVAMTVSGRQALKGTDLEFLAPYRYVKLSMSTAQTNGVKLMFILKG